ncbi:hypothetical protein J2Z44_001207 [Clostridium punense]|uniref:DUF2680 domain-containing protein n=1 Tax=Clostridium punense TaxID=1054297 RepID=A0ABS4K2F4_9CLOT|nr:MULTISPECIES: hypothetical protein [Clostridium]EQB89074.1 hypothetical protein M918_03285 [Clostridium sp. BL8]MBP2021411.1 hypothetical protein [Clostridium punense]
MKKKNLMMVLTLTLALGACATAYASSDTTTPSNSNYAVCQGSGLRGITGVKGYDFMTNLLKEKFGIEETTITEGRAAGKTMYDLVSEKGITAEEFKSTMVEEKIKSIDEAINSGSVTKEQGEAIKARIEENSAPCTTPGEGEKGKGNGNIGGENGQRRGAGKGMGNGAGMKGVNRGTCGNLSNGN